MDLKKLSKKTTIVLALFLLLIITAGTYLTIIRPWTFAATNDAWYANYNCDSISGVSSKYLFDQSGNSMKGYLSGTYGLKDKSISGKSIYLDSTGYISINNNSNLALNNNLTLSLYFYPENISVHRNILIHKSSTGEFSLVLETTGALTYYHRNLAKTILPAGSITNNNWYRLVVSRTVSATGGTINTYLNGVIKSSNTFTSTQLPAKTTNKIYVGKTSASSGIKAYFDNVEIRREALGQTVIEEDYKSFARSHLNYIGYWDDYGLVNYPDRYEKIKDHSNLIFLNSFWDSNQNRFLDFKNYSDNYNDPKYQGKKLVIWSNIKTLHICNGDPDQNNCTITNDEIWINQRFQRIKDFIEGKGEFATRGVNIKDRVYTIVLFEEPLKKMQSNSLERLVVIGKKYFKTSTLTIPQTINYRFSTTWSGWNNYVPTALDWIATDIYVQPQANEQADFALVTADIELAIAYNKPVILIPQAYYSGRLAYDADPNCPNDDSYKSSPFRRKLSTNEEKWYFDKAKSEPLIKAMLWWTFSDKVDEYYDTNTKEYYCEKSYGSANINFTNGQPDQSDPDKDIYDAHKNWGQQIMNGTFSF